MRRFGVPYMGSKNKIAEWVVSLLPAADTLYDLFAGGCAITDCAMQSNKFKNFIINDIQSDITQLFVDCVSGKYKNETRWISREEFFALKDSDPYIKYCWSFGNKGNTYIYGRHIEQHKKALHYAIVFNDYSIAKEQGLSLVPSSREGAERRLDILSQLKKTTKTEPALISDSKNIDIKLTPNYSVIQNLQCLERVQSIERPVCSLESLQRLERLQDISAGAPQGLQRFNTSYDNIPIAPNSVIYCDIPYVNTASYDGGKQVFDHNKFYNWALKQTNPVFISEYYMPDDFICIAEIKKRNTLSATANNLAIEKIYVPHTQYKEMKQWVQLELF